MNSTLFYRLILGWFNYFSGIALKGAFVLVPSILIVLCFKRISSQFKHFLLLLSVCSMAVLPVLFITADVIKISHKVEIGPTNIVSQSEESIKSNQISNFNNGEQKAASKPENIPCFSSNSIWAGWMLYLSLIWIIGLLFLLARILIGQYGVILVTRRTGELQDDAVLALLMSIQKEIGLNRRVRLYRHNADVYPFTVGIFHPAVILPKNAFNWSKEKMKLVLIHELAHIKRHDNLTQLIARIICAVYWFNPLVWVISRLLRFEREKACDESVLYSGVKSVEYARQLLDITRSLYALKPPIALSSSMARVSDIETRIVNILNPSGRKGKLGFLKISTCIIILICMLIPLSLVSVAAFDGTENKSNPEISIYDHNLVEFKDATLGISIRGAQAREIPALFPLSFYDKDIREGIASKLGDYYSIKPGRVSINNGIDIDLPLDGECVIATADGVLEIVSDSSEYGKFAIIKHKYGFYTLYANLDDVLRKPGDNVSAGEIIGSTGKSKTLHYELRYDSKPLNPIPLYTDKKQCKAFLKISANLYDGKKE